MNIDNRRLMLCTGVLAASACAALALVADARGIVDFRGLRGKFGYANGLLGAQADALGRLDVPGFMRPYSAQCEFTDRTTEPSRSRKLSKAEFRSIFTRALRGIKLTAFRAVNHGSSVEYFISGHLGTGERRLVRYELFDRIGGVPMQINECEIARRLRNSAGFAGKPAFEGTWVPEDREDSNDLDVAFYSDGRVVFGYRDVRHWNTPPTHGSRRVAGTYTVLDATHFSVRAHVGAGTWTWEAPKGCTLLDGVPFAMKLTDPAGHDHYLAR